MAANASVRRRAVAVRFPRPLIFGTAAAGVAWIAGCGDGATDPPPPPTPPPDPPRPATVSVTPSAAALTALGATVPLTAEVRDQNGQAMAGTAVTWASGTPAVATVDASGLVTAVDNGTATITATAGSASGSATVTVAQEVSAVAVTPAADTVVAGDTLRLAAEAADANGRPVADAEFDWASSDTLVATVDDAGLVTGVGAGDAEVTATAAGVAGAAALAVVAPPLPVVAVVVSPAADTIGRGDTLRLAAEAFDENGHRVEGAEFRWSSSDVSLLRVDRAGLVTGVDEGTATITAAAGDASGVSEITVESPDRASLVALYEATGGSGWKNRDGWLSERPVRWWHGVGADFFGRVIHLLLGGNGLSGAIPPEVANFSRLRQLDLQANALSGPIPPELGRLTDLTRLNLDRTGLSGPIPPDLGNLAKLTQLWLQKNDLAGPIPPELGRLASLEKLVLTDNALSGPIPPELGNLASVGTLWLDGNELSGPIPPELGSASSLSSLRLNDNGLSGPIPPELGNLVELTSLYLDINELSGPIPPELGSLASLSGLHLGHNELSGPIPPEFGGLSELVTFVVAGNAGMSGPLPTSLTNLRSLETLSTVGTGLCAPSDEAFLEWLAAVPTRRVLRCESDAAAAYLVQAVQSRDFPVPLVAGERALLRVFPTAGRATSEGIPPVRARFYVDGRETHVEDIPGTSAPIPTEVDEGDLSLSANVEIPGSVIQPGLEMVIEVDPGGTLEPGLGVASRIPATGRVAVEVSAMPTFHLTAIPFLWRQKPDSLVLDITGAMAEDPQNHPLLGMTRTLLPVGDFTLVAHEPVVSAHNNAFELSRETALIRALEGGHGYYIGTMTGEFAGIDGIVTAPRVVFAKIDSGDRSEYVIAHELGHTMSLNHPPGCGARGLDRVYPYANGRIGAWGYDFDGEYDGENPVPPTVVDLMSYCGSRWISDYHFSKALRHRVATEPATGASVVAAGGAALLVWGGADADGVPALEPSFVVDAPPALPQSPGEYRLTGRTGSGAELFSLSFAMPETFDGDGSSSFAFALPVGPGWEGSLSSITLTGPGGSVTLDAESDRPTAILRNPINGQIRGILRDLPAVSPEPGLEVLFSRGIPGEDAWRR